MAPLHENSNEQPLPNESTPEAISGTNRRRWLKIAGFAAAPLIVTVHARPVWAAGTTPSANSGVGTKSKTKGKTTGGTGTTTGGTGTTGGTNPINIPKPRGPH